MAAKKRNNGEASSPSTAPAKPVTTLPDGKICDFIDQKIRKDSPEEYVRQNIERRLVLELDYLPERIDVSPGYIYAWLASDYGKKLVMRNAYGPLILEIDKEMFGSVPTPLPDKTVIREVGDLVMKANDYRDNAWRKEREAISQIENLIVGDGSRLKSSANNGDG